MTAAEVFPDPAPNPAHQYHSLKVSPRLSGITTPSSSTIKALTDIKYGRAEERPLRELHYEDAKALVELQQQYHFPYLSDGQQLWGDLLRPVYEGMENVEVGSQTRWFETNGFCFPPRIVGKPKAGKPQRNESHLAKYLYLDLVPERRQLTLPGLYTLCRMAENVAEIGTGALLEAFAQQLEGILETLPRGTALVEFTEPALAYDVKTDYPQRKQMLALAKLSYQYLLRQHRTITIIQLPDDDWQAIPELLDLSVDGFGVDLLETIPTTIPAKTINLEGKILSAGIINAWESYPDDLNWAEQRVRQAIGCWQPERVYITTNAQLYHTISHQYAQNKIQKIISLAERLGR